MATPYSGGPAFIFVGVGDAPAPTPSTTTGSMWEPPREGPDLDFPDFQAAVAALGGGLSGNLTATLLGPGSPPSAQRPATVSPAKRPLYLGTAIDTPEIHFKPYFRPVRSDDTAEAADDVFFLGEEAIVVAEVNRWNESVYARISSRPNYGFGRGSISELHTGALLRRGGYTYGLWIQMPYSNKTVFGGGPANPVAVPVGGGLPLGRLGSDPAPPGFHFFHAYLLDDGLPRLGTAARRLSLRWHCIREPRRDAVTAQNFGAQRPRRLYDHDLSGLPLPD